MIPIANLLNNVNGLPTHPLIVHFTEVFAVAGAIGGLGFALVPKFRGWLSYPLLFVGFASIALGLLTPATGERLENRVDVSALLEKHTELGGQMGTILIAYGVILILAMATVLYRGKGATSDASAAPSSIERIGGIPGRPLHAFGAQPVVAAVLVGLVLIGSLISGVWIYRTGEAGAKSVWGDLPATVAQPVGGDGDAK